MKNILFFFFFSFIALISCKEESITPIPETTNTWEKVADLPGYYYHNLKIKGNTIYMICYNEGYKFASSQDSGKSWQVSDLNFYVKDFGFLSVEGNKFYISGYDGLFESSDNGLTWRENISLREYVNPTIAFHSLTDISVSGNVIFVGQIADSYMAYYANGLIYSSDRGLSWTCPSNFPTYRVVALKKFDRTLVFCDNKIQYSFDSLNTWYFANGGEKEIVEFYEINSRLFAVGYISIKISNTSGTSWIECCPTISTDEVILPKTFTSTSDKIFVMNNKGVLHYSDQSDLE